MQLPCLTGGHRQLLIVFEEQPKGCCCCTWGRAVVKKKLRAEKERRTGASHNASKGIIVISCHQEIVDFYLESTICSLLLCVVGRQEPTRAWPVSSQTKQEGHIPPAVLWAHNPAQQGGCELGQITVGTEGA